MRSKIQLRKRKFCHKILRVRSENMTCQNQSQRSRKTISCTVPSVGNQLWARRVWARSFMMGLLIGILHKWKRKNLNKASFQQTNRLCQVVRHNWKSQFQFLIRKCPRSLLIWTLAISHSSNSNTWTKSTSGSSCNSLLSIRRKHKHLIMSSIKYSRAKFKYSPCLLTQQLSQYNKTPSCLLIKWNNSGNSNSFSNSNYFKRCRCS